MSILDDIAAYKRAELEAAKTAQPLPAVMRAAREAPCPEASAQRFRTRFLRNAPL
jgi:hypothetical protein